MHVITVVFTSWFFSMFFFLRVTLLSPSTLPQHFHSEVCSIFIRFHHGSPWRCCGLLKRMIFRNEIPKSPKRWWRLCRHRKRVERLMQMPCSTTSQAELSGILWFWGFNRIWWWTTPEVRQCFGWWNFDEPPQCFVGEMMCLRWFLTLIIDWMGFFKRLFAMSTGVGWW